MTKITRKNRDRHGGHKSTDLRLGFQAQGATGFTSLERATLKRQTKRSLRQKCRKEERAAQVEFIQDRAYWDWEAHFEEEDRAYHKYLEDLLYQENLQSMEPLEPYDDCFDW